jgi:hypothetical protein
MKMPHSHTWTASIHLQFTTSNWQLQPPKSKLCYDQWSVGQSVLVWSVHLRPKTRLVLLSHSCGFFDVGRPLWQEDRSFVYNCCWSSPAQSYLCPIISSDHFASWVLIQFLWWPLFCLLLTWRKWAQSWSAEILFWLLWTCRSEMKWLH